MSELGEIILSTILCVLVGIALVLAITMVIAELAQ